MGDERIEAYIAKHDRWSAGLEAVRKLLLALPLEERVKWGTPCYVHAGRNVVSLAAFKDWFALWFHDAEGLDDPAGVLVQAEGGKSESLRHLRFRSRRDVKQRLVRDYVRRAIARAAEPRRADRRKAAKVVVPPELAAALRSDPEAARAFDALTPGRRRDFAEHVAEAKRAETKARRLEKILPMIRAGEGLNDRYRC